MPNLVFLHGGSSPRCTATVDKYFVGYSCLQFMTRGGIELFYGDHRHELRGPWFWTAFPGPHIRFHTLPSEPFWTHRYVAFRGDLVEQWRAEGLWPEAPQSAPHPERCAGLFDELIAHSQRSDLWGQRRAVNLLESLLLQLADDRALPAAEKEPQEPWLQLVLARLDQPGTLTPDYAALARECHMGLSTLRRRFSQATGTSLHAFALSRRIAHARDLLGESPLPVKAVAESLGYANVYFFSNQFRQQTGVSPAAYRKSRQG